MVTRACLRYAREGQNVTQAGPKCHTSRAKMSHKGQNVTQSCYNEQHCTYRQTSDKPRTLVSHKIVDHSDVVAAAPTDDAPTISSSSTKHLASMDWADINYKTKRETFPFWDLVPLMLEVWGYTWMSANTIWPLEHVGSFCLCSL